MKPDWAGALLRITIAVGVGAAIGWLVGQTIPWMLVGAITGFGAAVLISLFGVRSVVAIPVAVGAGIGAYVGGTIVGVLCQPEGCPIFEGFAAVATGVGALVGIGLVVALATKSFDEYRELNARQNESSGEPDPPLPQ